MSKGIIILFLLLATTNLFSLEKSGFVYYNETIVAKDRFTTSNYLGDKKGEESVTQNIFKIKYYNYLTDNLFFNGLVGWRNTNIDDKYAKEVMRYRFSSNKTFVESLYLTYHLHKDWYVSGGVIPFMNGSYNELSDLGHPNGTGLAKIIDSPMEGIFLMKKGTLFGNKTLTRVGYTRYGDKSGIMDDSVEDNAVGTHGYYFTYDYYDGFDTLKFNLFKTEYHIDGYHAADINVAAIGGNKYFTKYGIDVYGTLAFAQNQLFLAKTNGDASVPLPVKILFPNSYEFKDTDKTNSYLYSIGVTKDFDVKGLESINIGTEYTHASENWAPLINNRYNDIQYNSYFRGDSIFAWITTRFTRNTALKLFYGVTHYDGAMVVGNTTKTIPFDQTPRVSLKKMERYGLKLIIKF